MKENQFRRNIARNFDLSESFTGDKNKRTPSNSIIFGAHKMNHIVSCEKWFFWPCHNSNAGQEWLLCFQDTMHGLVVFSAWDVGTKNISMPRIITNLSRGGESLTWLKYEKMFWYMACSSKPQKLLQNVFSKILKPSVLHKCWLLTRSMAMPKLP